MIVDEYFDALKRDGAAAELPTVDREQARGYTRNLAATHYENFPVVTRVLPAHLRQHFANIYAYCRWSDDLGDEIGDPKRSLELLDWWEAELRRCYSGTPTHPVMLALSETIQRFDIPEQPFLDLLTAFRRDQQQVRYETFSDLLDYCRCSANPVGHLVLFLCDRFNDENAELSDLICTGLQLANFWQDIAVDVEKGRIYVPREDWTRFAVAETDFLEKRFTPAMHELLAFEVERADEFLRRGMILPRRIPGRLGIVVAMLALGGRVILRKIRRVGYNVFRERPKLGKWDLPGLASRAIVHRVMGGRRPRTVST